MQGRARLLSVKHTYELKNSAPAKAGEFLYGTFHAFAAQMRIGAQDIRKQARRKPATQYCTKLASKEGEE